MLEHALRQHLLGDGHGVDGGGELLGRQHVLQHVVAEVERRRRLPLRAVLEELVQVVPVALGVVVASLKVLPALERYGREGLLNSTCILLGRLLEFVRGLVLKKVDIRTVLDPALGN